MTEKRMKEIIQACVESPGNMSDTERAIGILVSGRYFGWHYLFLIHTRSYMAKIEKVLGVSLKEELPERTEHSDRIWAIRVADKFSAFWKAQSSGEIGTKHGKVRPL